MNPWANAKITNFELSSGPPVIARFDAAIPALGCSLLKCRLVRHNGHVEVHSPSVPAFDAAAGKLVKHASGKIMQIPVLAWTTGSAHRLFSAALLDALDKSGLWRHGQQAR